jgi:hypothetical protein
VRLNMSAKKQAKGTIATSGVGANKILEAPEGVELLSDFNQAKFDVWQIEDALSKFREGRNLEPLLEQLQEGNSAILRNPEALQIIADAARGRLKRGKGNVRAIGMQERDMSIWLAAFRLHQMGYPIKNDPDLIRADAAQKPSACRIIGEYLRRSESAIYSVLKKHGGVPKDGLSSFPWNEASDGELTPELVLDQYLSRSHRG